MLHSEGGLLAQAGDRRASLEDTGKSITKGGTASEGWRSAGSISACRRAKVCESQYMMRGRVTGSEGRKAKGKALKVTKRTLSFNF